MNTNKTLITMCLALGLGACTAKVSSDGGSGSAPAASFKDAVSGPNLDGEWKSACVNYKWDSNSYIIYDATLKGRNLTRVESLFSDSSCTQPTKTYNRAGLFRYTKNYGSGIYEVEYQLAMNGGTYTVAENIKLDPTILWISDRYTGAAELPDIALNLIGTPPSNLPSPTPAPAPTGRVDPSQIQGIAATSLATANYAYCSAQANYAVLIDFQDINLATQSSGTAKIGTRPCDASQPYKWQSVNFTLTTNGGINMDLGPSGFGDDNTLSADSSLRNGYGVIFGNSGPCTFLTNEGTLGLHSDPNDPFYCK